MIKEIATFEVTFSMEAVQALKAFKNGIFFKKKIVIIPYSLQLKL